MGGLFCVRFFVEVDGIFFNVNVIEHHEVHSI